MIALSLAEIASIWPTAGGEKKGQTNVPNNRLMRRQVNTTGSQFSLLHAQGWSPRGLLVGSLSGVKLSSRHPQHLLPGFSSKA